jgi:hypothetical protein
MLFYVTLCLIISHVAANGNVTLALISDDDNAPYVPYYYLNEPAKISWRAYGYVPPSGVPVVPTYADIWLVSYASYGRFANKIIGMCFVAYIIHTNSH